MPVKIKFLAVIPDGPNCNFRAFFFCKKFKYLIAFPIPWDQVEFLLNKESNKIPSREKAILQLLDQIDIKCIALLRQNKGYCASIQIRGKSNKPKVLNMPFRYALAHVCRENTILKMSVRDLKQDGTYITKKLLLESLEQK